MSLQPTTRPADELATCCACSEAGQITQDDRHALPVTATVAERLARVAAWLRVATDAWTVPAFMFRTTRADDPHPRMVRLTPSMLSDDIRWLFAQLEERGVKMVELVTDGDRQAVSATNQREPLYKHKRTGRQCRLVGEALGALAPHERVPGVVLRKEDGTLVWIAKIFWTEHFERVV